MASSLETKVLYDHKVSNLPNKIVNYFPNQEIQLPKVTPQRPLIRNTELKPQIKGKETTKSEAAPLTRKKYSKFTISLICSAFILLAGQAVIYFHSVQVQKNSIMMQSKIIEMKEQNYRFNVELAKTKELTKVEMIAQKDLQMKPSLSSKINYLILPENVTNKEYLITKVFPEPKQLSINIGY